MASLQRPQKQAQEDKTGGVATDAKTDTTTAQAKPQGASVPVEDVYGAKDPDQDCDMVTALDRDALTPTELKFLEAARTNRCNILSSILARPNFNINVKTNLNRTALHMAASQGNLEAVQLLVKAKILIDTVDKHGMTPLFWAAFKDQVNVVLYLLQRGAEPGRRTKRGYSLLHVIAKADAIKTMEALLRRKKITNLTEYDNDDMTPLMIAASSGSILATTVLSKLGHIEDHIDQVNRLFKVIIQKECQLYKTYNNAFSIY
uniref:Ankyrin repeat and death domain-containing protein 1B n=2 Tax=Schistocephalus solidus TaxID=70667 RepID=A0A0X3PNT1_SCHSO